MARAPSNSISAPRGAGRNITLCFEGERHNSSRLESERKTARVTADMQQKPIRQKFNIALAAEL
jgi:hypothetical protein